MTPNTSFGVVRLVYRTRGWDETHLLFALISGVIHYPPNCCPPCLQRDPAFKGELQRENKLISYERVFKMLENDMYIAGIGQAVLELLSFKVESGNHQRGFSLLQKISDIFGNMRLVPLKMTSHLTSHNFKNIKN